VAEVLFTRDGDRYVPTELARGPWDPESCHGGAPSALLAALVDGAPSLTDMQVVRLTYDIVRPVPLAPVEVHLTTIREGKRIQVVEADLTTPDGVELVRCRALRVRTREVAVPSDATDDTPAPSPGPEQAAREVARVGEAWGTGFWTAVEVRPTTGSVLGEPGPGTAWFRLTVPIAEGVPTTPIARVAAAADFGNGLAPPLAIDRFLYVNPDLTVDVHRLPIGEWVALDSRSVARPSGVGLTTSTLSDREGRLGTAMQSLFVEARA
jgi:hypothetical protein